MPAIPDTPDPVAEFIALYPDLTGSKTLCLLKQKPGQYIWCKDLILAISPADTHYTPEQIHWLSQNREAIPMTDKTALKQVRKELMKLYRKKADLQTAGKTSPKVEADITACERYIKDTTTPYGIKSFVTDEKQAYDSIRAAIRRLIRKAEKEHPEAAHEIKKHLQTGRYSVWRS